MISSDFLQGNIIMNGESIAERASEFSKLHLQSIRRLHVTVEVLDQNNKTVDVLQGVSTGGSMNVNGTSLIRRTGSMSFVLFDKLLPNEKSSLWMTNKIRVYTGIDDLSTFEGIATHFCLGTFFITEPSVTISKDNRTITIELQDRMAMWETEQLENKLIIEPETPVSVGIKSLLSVMGETQFAYIEDTLETVPYQIEFAQGSNVLEAIQKLRDLYMDWEAFYDTEGNFVFRKMKMTYDKAIIPHWKFDEESPLLLTFTENFTYKEVKNRVLVYGAMNEKTGLTPKSQADLVPDSLFGANKIGIKKKIIIDAKYTKKEQCEAKSKFELWKSSSLQEKITITTVPVYFLDANHILEVWNPATAEVERYIIDTIGFGLGANEPMNITAHKIYYDDVLLDTHDAKITYLIDMITNKGWLSIPEARIKAYYGLEGDGSKLVVNFEYNQSGGTTAYITGYMGTTTQLLTIDLVDLGEGIGDSGDNPLDSKADYTDRILGHEMLHAVMNNNFGMDKISKLPVWFTEGSAELLHGADERVKVSIVDNGSINDERLSYIIDLGVLMLTDGRWDSASDSYSSSYLIMKYIDKKITTGKDMKAFMNSIKVSTKNGFEALKDAVVANTAFTTYEAFIADFKTNGVNFVKTNMTLNLTGDEVDTGSIGGIDHRGQSPLNAESIFDNSSAVAGLISSGFSVEFDRP